MSKLTGNFQELIKQSAWFWVALGEFILILIILIGTLLAMLISPDRVNVENSNQNNQTLKTSN